MLEEKENDLDFVCFQQLLVTKCLLELEKNLSDDTERKKLVEVIDECQDIVSLSVFFYST